jgi:hypothetical protein
MSTGLALQPKYVFDGLNASMASVIRREQMSVRPLWANLRTCTVLVVRAMVVEAMDTAPIDDADE